MKPKFQAPQEPDDDWLSLFFALFNAVKIIFLGTYGCPCWHLLSLSINSSVTDQTAGPQDQTFFFWNPISSGVNWVIPIRLHRKWYSLRPFSASPLYARTMVNKRRSCVHRPSWKKYICVYIYTFLEEKKMNCGYLSHFA